MTPRSPCGLPAFLNPKSEAPKNSWDMSASEHSALSGTVAKWRDTVLLRTPKPSTPRVEHIRNLV
jgi:hypothetical protein